MPMDRSPDCMDLDVGDDRRETAWWEDLTKDSVRMQELVGKLNPACLPIDETRPPPEVDLALEGVYYARHPRNIPVQNFHTARAHTIFVINYISRQNHRNAGGSAGSMGAFTSTLNSYLSEGYPESAPFNGEALHSRAGDSAGDGGSGSSSHGGSGGPGGGGPSSLRERPRTADCFHPCDTQPHPRSPYESSATPTLSDCPTYSPGRSNSGSPGPPSATDGCHLADEIIRPYPFPSTRNSPRRPRINSHSRSVLNRGQPPIHTGHHFDVPPPRFPNGTGLGGQHKCDECGKAFPYPSKLKDHKHTHQHDKPLPCDHPSCHKKFKRPRELLAHKKIHERKSQFVETPGIAIEPQRVAGASPPAPHPPPPRTTASPRQLPSFMNPECSPRSEPPDSDRTSSSSPGEGTLSRSSSPDSSHLGGGVATLGTSVTDPPGVEGQGEDAMSQIPEALHVKLNIQLFPGLAG